VYVAEESRVVMSFLVVSSVPTRGSCDGAGELLTVSTTFLALVAEAVRIELGKVSLCCFIEEDITECESLDCTG